MSVRSWGFSLAERRSPALEDTGKLAEVLELEAVELPGAILGRLEVTTLLKKRNGKQLAFSRILDSSLARQAAELEGKLGYDFMTHFAKQTELARSLGAERVEIDPDLARIPGNPEYRAKVSRLIRALYAPYQGAPLRMALPLRLPQAGTGVTEAELAAALRDLMLPELELSLELHIHEVHFNDEFAEKLDAFKYCTGAVRVVYEPELGNAPTIQQLKPLIHRLEYWQREVDIYLAPVHTRAETSEAELERYLRLADRSNY